jgi:4-hydroxy-tetrahydrodipicolinate synthase
MNKDEAIAGLKGVFNIAVTPFSRDGSLDRALLRRNIERVLDLGLDGLLIGGTYGEFPGMSVAERADLFGAAIDAAGKKRPVLLCTAASDPRIAADLTKQAVALGGIPMLTAPFVSEVEDEHIVAFFRDLAAIARDGLVIYNAPGIGITLSPSLIERLSDIDGVIGLKQGALDPTIIDDLANRLAGKIALFCASDLAFLGPAMAGFDGVSSTNSCVFPEIIRATWSALAEGAARRAIDLHRCWYAYRALARRFGQPQTVKAAMQLRGWDGGRVRAPLLPITEAQRAELAPVVARIAARCGELSAGA